METTIDSWANDAADDIERRCRTLRGTALRHAITLDDLDTDALARHLDAPEQRLRPPCSHTRAGASTVVLTFDVRQARTARAMGLSVVGC